MWGRNKQLEAVRELGLSRAAVQELCELAKSDNGEDKFHLAVVSELILDKELVSRIFDARCNEESERISRKAEEYAFERLGNFIHSFKMAEARKCV